MDIMMSTHHSSETETFWGLIHMVPIQWYVFRICYGSHGWVVHPLGRFFKRYHQAIWGSLTSYGWKGGKSRWSCGTMLRRCDSVWESAMKWWWFKQDASWKLSILKIGRAPKGMFTSSNHWFLGAKLVSGRVFDRFWLQGCWERKQS